MASSKVYHFLTNLSPASMNNMCCKKRQSELQKNRLEVWHDRKQEGNVFCFLNCMMMRQYEICCILAIL